MLFGNDDDDKVMMMSAAADNSGVDDEANLMTFFSSRSQSPLGRWVGEGPGNVAGFGFGWLPVQRLEWEGG